MDDNTANSGNVIYLRIVSYVMPGWFPRTETWTLLQGTPEGDKR